MPMPINVDTLLIAAIVFHLVALLLGVFSIRSHLRSIATQAAETEAPFKLRLRKRAA